MAAGEDRPYLGTKHNKDKAIPLPEGVASCSPTYLAGAFSGVKEWVLGVEGGIIARGAFFIKDHPRIIAVKTNRKIAFVWVQLSLMRKI